jgi:hypothetical protein
LSKSEGEGQSFVKRLKLRGQGDIIKVRESTFCKKTKVEYARSHIMEVREAKLDICKSFSQYSLYFNNLLLILSLTVSTYYQFSSLHIFRKIKIKKKLIETRAFLKYS